MSIAALYNTSKTVIGLLDILFPFYSGMATDQMRTVDLSRKLLILAIHVEMDMNRCINPSITIKGLRKWFKLHNILDTLAGAYASGRILRSTEAMRLNFLSGIDGISVCVSGAEVHDLKSAESHFMRISVPMAHALDVLYELSGMTVNSQYSDTHLSLIQ